MARNLRTYTPKKAAEEIGCSADTIRRYCALYSRHLSEGATPAPGKPRVLTALDVYLLKLAKSQAEAGLMTEEIDQLLETVAIPEDVAGLDDDQVETLPATTTPEVPEAVALLRQMAATLERLESREARLAKLEEEVVGLRDLVDSMSSSSSPAAEDPKPSPASSWSPYLPFLVGVGVVALLILAVALVVALFP